MMRRGDKSNIYALKRYSYPIILVNKIARLSSRSQMNIMSILLMDNSTISSKDSCNNNISVVRCKVLPYPWESKVTITYYQIESRDYLREVLLWTDRG